MTASVKQITNNDRNRCFVRMYQAIPMARSNAFFKPFSVIHCLDVIQNKNKIFKMNFGFISHQEYMDILNPIPPEENALKGYNVRHLFTRERFVPV